MKAAPEGVAMLSKDGSSWLALDRLCKEHRVSDRVRNELEMSVRALQLLENGLLAETEKTETQRDELLQKVERLAAKLKTAIEELPSSDRISLDCEYFETQYRDLNKLYDIEDLVLRYDNLEDPREFDRFFKYHDLAEKQVPAIAAAAQAVRHQFSKAAKPGRKPQTKRQAAFIGSIADSLSAANIAPSYTGLFLDFCTSIFEAAGLKFPDRAFVHFMTKMR